MITEEGVYDLPEHEYHRDPVAGGSLSSSVARKLLPPSCPAVARWEIDHPTPPTEAMERGTIVHALVLGRGADVVVVDADDWRSKAARDARDQARADGKTPILRDRFTVPQAMARAVLTDPVASRLLTGGHPEQVLVWRDDPSGTWCRAMVDYRRPELLVDVKTCVDASPAGFRKAAWEHRYDVQDAFYRRGEARLTGRYVDEVPFVFVAVSSTPPHLVQTYQLTGWPGMADAEHAITTWAECTRTDVWPTWDGHDDVIALPPPAWAR